MNYAAVTWVHAASAMTAATLCGAQPALAQEFVQNFINPSFGGNPFNSDHLIAIATLDRPAAPEDETPAPTPEDLLVSQLQASLNATLSSNVLRTIQNAQPGQSGSFNLGDTRVSFTRTASETRVTFVNSRTGEQREIVVPVAGAATSGAASATTLGSAERILAATSATAPVSPLSRPAARIGESGMLLAPPPL